jgi:thiol-disulfide isomerase/thioredoxin
MQSYGRLLIVLVLSVLSGWFLFQKTIETSEPETNKSAPSANIDKNMLMNASFTNINGQQQSLKQWQGNIIVLNFWATWCPPCREEMPELSAMQDQYKQQNLVIVGLSTDDLDTTKTYMKSAPVSYPILAGDMEAMNLAETLGNNRGILPYTVIVDANGTVVKTFFGRINQQLLEKTITPLLQVSAVKEKQ